MNIQLQKPLLKWVSINIKQCKKNSLVCREIYLRTGLKNVPVDKDLERPIVHDDDGEDNGT